MSLGTEREHWLIQEAWERAKKDSSAEPVKMEIVAEDILLDCPIRPKGYRRGTMRLVGRALCSECLQQQPALTCFDVAANGMSCGWQVCDDCLRKMLPAPEAEPGTRWVKLEDVEDALVEGVSNAAVVEKLGRSAVSRAAVVGPQCNDVCSPSERIFSPFCPLHGPGGPENALKVHTR